jgi:hypothetical protein
LTTRTSATPSIGSINIHLCEPKWIFRFLHGISTKNPIHRSLIHPHDFSALSRDLPRLSFGFRGFMIPTVKSSCPLELVNSDSPMCSLPALAPPGYALVHVTASHKTAALCLSGFRVFSFLMSRTSIPLNSQSSIYQYMLYSLALLAKLLAYMTTIPS